MTQRAHCGHVLSLVGAAILLALSPYAGLAQPSGAVPLATIRPPIVTREQWRASTPLPIMKPQRVRGIILHHTAVRQNPRTSLETK